MNDLSVVLPGSTKGNLPSFSRETWSVTLSPMKIGEIGAGFCRRTADISRNLDDFLGCFLEVVPP